MQGTLPWSLRFPPLFPCPGSYYSVGFDLFGLARCDIQKVGWAASERTRGTALEGLRASAEAPGWLIGLGLIR